MSLGNLFHWEPKWLVWIYPLSLILLHSILKQFRFRKAKFEMGKLAVGCVFLFVALLAVPRLTYVLEWVEGYSAIPHADDWARLGEMISLTQSERFPLLHPANQNFTFSFYYAALIPWAVLKLAIPILTLKDVIFLGNAGYQMLILMSLLEVGCRWLPSRRSLFVTVQIISLCHIVFLYGNPRRALCANPRPLGSPDVQSSRINQSPCGSHRRGRFVH